MSISGNFYTPGVQPKTGGPFVPPTNTSAVDSAFTNPPAGGTSTFFKPDVNPNVGGIFAPPPNTGAYDSALGLAAPIPVAQGHQPAVHSHVAAQATAWHPPMAPTNATAPAPMAGSEFLYQPMFSLNN